MSATLIVLAVFVLFAAVIAKRNPGNLLDFTSRLARIAFRQHNWPLVWVLLWKPDEIISARIIEVPDEQAAEPGEEAK